MKFHQHASNNMLLGSNGIPKVEIAPATMVVDEGGGIRILTFWRPSAEELAALNHGHSVCLQVMGKFHLLVALTVEKP